THRANSREAGYHRPRHESEPSTPKRLLQGLRGGCCNLPTVPPTRPAECLPVRRGYCVAATPASASAKLQKLRIFAGSVQLPLPEARSVRVGLKFVGVAICMNFRVTLTVGCSMT